MSMVPPGDANPFATIRATSSFEDDEAALEALVQLKDMELDEWFDDRNTNLDTDEQEGISISFFKDSTGRYLLLHTDEDGTLNIDLALGGGAIDGFPVILNKILDRIEKISYNQCTVQKTFETTFRSLNLPIEEDTDFTITGIRIQSGGGDFIIQKSSDDEVSVGLRVERDEGYKDEIPADLISREIDRINELIEEKL